MKLKHNQKKNKQTNKQKQSKKQTKQTKQANKRHIYVPFVHKEAIRLKYGTPFLPDIC